MSTAEKIALVEKAVALHDALDAQWALAAEVFDGITGPLFDASNAPVMAYIELVEECIGDVCQSVQWFIFDNESGKRGFECTHNGTAYTIRTAADLVAFIELTS